MDHNTKNMLADEINILLHAGTIKPGYRFHTSGRAADRLIKKGLITSTHNVDKNCINLTEAGQIFFDHLMKVMDTCILNQT